MGTQFKAWFLDAYTAILRKEAFARYQRHRQPAQVHESFHPDLGLSCAPFTRALKKCSTWQESYLCRQLMFQRTMTGSRFKQEGRILKDICPLCQAEGDDMYHRLLECQHPKAVEQRKQ